MSNIADLFRDGAANAWLFAPTAVALGALHGLEPGHSKTMMAAFIVAVRGTVAQAVLLGLAATLSHTAIVWIIALGGVYFGSRWSTEANEPYLQIASGVLILAVAAWMAWRTWADRREVAAHSHHEHDHHHDHDHHHEHSHDALLALDEETLGAHERAHAEEIERRFSNRRVTTGQILLFGLTGGLIPCPASITVLLLCLQLDRMILGAALVLAFSIGLALTMIAVGVAAAIGVRHASTRFSGFQQIAAKAPYFSGALVSLVGLYTIYSGFAALV
ncbi:MULTISPECIES: nickel/cobalt efflux transporter [Methylosinus]|uniref:Nickel/cobalt efflux system n=1 Tax=Methylosinus trichosporium (strain ATCC 35070 / NCIMB 11131 / UNIQEM 75 / OB3b) TaxID=595536 RepID=A0A2D2CXA4_METT3|nr:MULTISPECIES: nickel/cobalt efflux transporter [Methylosinus]ATQ67316.1 nickel/cobalt efflux transporter RcnA [Methylosinus trichosporium OB3b]OBS52061.1 nickel/cobalt efflux protein RcnA [Methylosinus sp. 3S-1]